MAAATTAIVPVRMASVPARRRSGGGGGVRRRGGRRSKVNVGQVKRKARTRVLALGGLSSFAFGLLQSKVDLPSIQGVPDTLTYGGVGAVLGVLTNSDTLLTCSLGPLFTGLNHLGQKGFGEGGVALGGEYDDSVQGEFDGVVAGDFDNL